MERAGSRRYRDHRVIPAATGTLRPAPLGALPAPRGCNRHRPRGAPAPAEPRQLLPDTEPAWPLPRCRCSLVPHGFGLVVLSVRAPAVAAPAGGPTGEFPVPDRPSPRLPARPFAAVAPWGPCPWRHHPARLGTDPASPGLSRGVPAPPGAPWFCRVLHRAWVCGRLPVLRSRCPGPSLCRRSRGQRCQGSLKREEGRWRCWGSLVHRCRGSLKPERGRWRCWGSLVPRPGVPSVRRRWSRYRGSLTPSVCHRSRGRRAAGGRRRWRRRARVAAAARLAPGTLCPGTWANTSAPSEPRRPRATGRCWTPPRERSSASQVRPGDRNVSRGSGCDRGAGTCLRSRAVTGGLDMSRGGGPGCVQGSGT